MAKKTSKTGAKAKMSAPKVVKIGAASKPRSKGEFFRTIADATTLSRKQVVMVFETMGKILAADLSAELGREVRMKELK